MSLRIEPNAEPIAGYRLIERLGGGGFGEVWKAEAPGGLFKAIKFVYGEISVDETIVFDDPDGSRAKQELKSLGRVKTVHHPYILSLERFDIIQGQLVIVMELADRTLWDRFKECRTEGLPGIPREELLNYMQETSEALDLMNTKYQLQHLDIKPQNIFLIFNHVKVADFGLVKDLANKQNATITGGVTPVYAAPETFDGWLSRQSDQYSLAIVYQELLTGQRPFAGSSMKQLILHHLQSAPDLSQLPPADRPIVARALSKNPDDRYPTCLEFVQLLRKATSALATPAEGKAPSNPSVATPVPMETSANFTAAVRGKAGPVKTADPNFSTEEGFNGSRPQILPPRPERRDAATAPPLPIERSTLTPGGPGPARRGKSSGSTSETHHLQGTLQPALVIGLGKLGIEALSQLRRRLSEEFGAPDALPQLRLLAIDTDNETLQHATNDPSRAALRMQEILPTRLQRPTYYIKSRDGKVPTDSWLNPKHLYRIPREQNQAGLRPLGRLAFVDNYRPIAKRIEAELLACVTPASPGDFPATEHLGLRAKTPRVYIAASLSGNTGSGMFLDVAYLARKLLRAQGHQDAEIMGLFFVPPAQRDITSSIALSNTFAALVELHHFSQRESLFSARYETASSSSKENVSEAGPAFQRSLLLTLPESKAKGSTSDNQPVMRLAGDFLCRDLTTMLGVAIDEQRREKMSLSNEWQLGKMSHLQSLGMFRILWPRHVLLEQSARRLSAQLVARWMQKDAKPLADTIRQWTQERWESLCMRSEDLIERFQKMTAEALQQTPEQILAEILNPLQAALCGPANENKPANLPAVEQAMSQLEPPLGSPEENRTAASAGQIEPSLLERSLADVALVIADESEQRLAELAVTLLEDPNYRLAGAEEALRQFFATVEQALQSHETLAKDMSDKAAQLHQRILLLLEAPPASAPANKAAPRRPAPGKGGPSGNDVFELVRTYAKTRYHSLLLTYLNRLYLALRGRLSDQIREVGFCRQRLSELHGLLQPAALKRDKANEQKTGERVLFPAGCLELNDAVERINQEISAADLLSFDERVQAWINTHCQALLQVCMGTSATVKNLAPAILQEAEAFLSARLQGNSVADMYLSRKRGQGDEVEDDVIVDDLERCYDEAAPELGRLSELNEISLVSLPNDEPGKELQRMLKKHLPELNILMTDRQDEMVFYREIISIPWKDLEQLGPIAQEAYEQRNAADPSALHSRDDIIEWQSPLASVRP